MALIYSYISATDSYSVISNSCTAGAVSIPSTYNNGVNGTKPVTSIGVSAFRFCGSITSITIPNSVTSIGESAFESCSSLTSLSIGSGVTSIGLLAFAGCLNLTTVTIPSNVTSIASFAFLNSYNIISFNVDLNNPNYSSDSGVLFDKNKSAIIQYPPAKIGSSYTIPDTVTKISDRSFQRCLNLTTMNIPNGVVTIETTAFYFCINLTNVTLPNNISSIASQVFGFCSSLISITIPNSVTSIGNNAFSDCTSLTSVKFLGNAPSLGGTDAFIRTNANLKIYYLRFTSGWTSTFGGKPTIAFTPSFNIIKSGGTGKLTTKKRN